MEIFKRERDLIEIDIADTKKAIAANNDSIEKSILRHDTFKESRDFLKTSLERGKLELAHLALVAPNRQQRVEIRTIKQIAERTIGLVESCDSIIASIKEDTRSLKNIRSQLNTRLKDLNKSAVEARLMYYIACKIPQRLNNVLSAKK